MNNYGTRYAKYYSMPSTSTGQVTLTKTKILVFNRNKMQTPAKTTETSSYVKLKDNLSLPFIRGHPSSNIC